MLLGDSVVEDDTDGEGEGERVAEGEAEVDGVPVEDVDGHRPDSAALSVTTVALPLCASLPVYVVLTVEPSEQLKGPKVCSPA